MHGHPYRRSSSHAAGRPRERQPDATAIYLLLLAIGAVRIALAVALGEPIGAEGTIALALMIAGVVGLIADR